LAVAIGIGAGVTLQALLGSFLVVRSYGRPLALHNGMDFVKLFLLTGPLTSLVSASVRVAALSAAGLVSADGLLPNWVEG
jgi:hypothetical protein